MNTQTIIGTLSSIIGIMLLASTYVATGTIAPFVLIYLGMGMVYISTIILLEEV